MPSDIKLDGEKLTIEGSVLNVRTPDLVLDSPLRRTKTGKPTHPSRRALVHDFDDGLTLNYGADYPGGVTVWGTMRVDAFRARQGNALACQSPDLVLDARERRGAASDPRRTRRALVHDFDDGLTVNWNEDYPGGTTIMGVVRFPGRLDILRERPIGRDPKTGQVFTETVEIDLWSTVEKLSEELASLKKRVATLEEE